MSDPREGGEPGDGESDLLRQRPWMTDTKNAAIDALERVIGAGGWAISSTDVDDAKDKKQAYIVYANIYKHGAPTEGNCRDIERMVHHTCAFLGHDLDVRAAVRKTQTANHAILSITAIPVRTLKSTARRVLVLSTKAACSVYILAFLLGAKMVLESRGGN